MKNRDHIWNLEAQNHEIAIRWLRLLHIWCPVGHGYTRNSSLIDFEFLKTEGLAGMDGP